MSYKMAKLGDVFPLIKNGASIKQGDNLSGIPVTRIETISSGIIDYSRLGFADIDTEKYSDYYLKDGDILMSHINSWAHLGKTAIAQNINSKIIHGMNLLVLRAKENLLLSAYAKYFFETSLFKNQLHKISNQSVNQSSFAISKLKVLQIPLPLLHSQKHIAEILDKADALRKKDQQLLHHYDNFAQSLFIEMFGDPIRNEKRWELKKLGEICNKITDGTHQSPKFKQSGIPFLLVSNIKNNKIDYNTEKYISEDDFNALNKRTPIEIGNILITTVGSYGNPAIIESDKKFAFQRHIGFLQPNHDLINYRFLFGALKTEFVRQQIDKKVIGVAQKTLNLNALKDIYVINPPMALQNHFASQTGNIEQQKERLKIQSQESENLFQALLQQAFNGSLN